MKAGLEPAAVCDFTSTIMRYAGQISRADGGTGVALVEAGDVGH